MSTTPATGRQHPPADESVQAVAIEVNQLPDEVLLAGFGTSDPRLTAVFVRRFQRVVFGVAKTITGDLGTAEDVTLQAFEQARRHVGMHGPPRGPVRSLLRTIARDIAVDAIHAGAANPVNRDDLEGLLTTISDAPAPRLPAHEGSAELRAMLARLPANQARAVTMVSIYGMTARQIADAEGIQLSAARRRIGNGMRNLRGAYHPSAAS
jgi:RNA polymerase sigma factor (sigma-70 family)